MAPTLVPRANAISPRQWSWTFGVPSPPTWTSTSPAQQRVLPLGALESLGRITRSAAPPTSPGSRGPRPRADDDGRTTSDAPASTSSAVKSPSSIPRTLDATTDSPGCPSSRCAESPRRPLMSGGWKRLGTRMSAGSRAGRCSLGSSVRDRDEGECANEVPRADHRRRGTRRTYGERRRRRHVPGPVGNDRAEVPQDEPVVEGTDGDDVIVVTGVGHGHGGVDVRAKGGDDLICVSGESRRVISRARSRASRATAAMTG